MSDKVVDLAAFRAVKSEDAKDWSVADCLRGVLRRIELGELSPGMVCIAMREQVPNDSAIDYAWSSAGVSKIETLGLLARHLDISQRKDMT